MGKALPKRMVGWIGQLGRKARTAGPGELWSWVYGHGVPTVFGVPIIRYHRITEQIYLGPQHGKFGRDRLRKAGVTASLSMRIGYSDVENELAFDDYLQLPTTDGSAPTVDQLHAGSEFIDRVVREGGSVYIHCQTGLGRGPTMAAAYLISQGMTLNDAVAAIKRVRPFTDLQPSQLEILQEFENACRGIDRVAARESAFEGK